MIALGEMTTLYPVSGAFTHYTARFVDPALGFALGWNYWYSYAITLPTEITAAALVISYWRDDINVAVWITIFLVVICSCVSASPCFVRFPLVLTHAPAASTSSASVGTARPSSGACSFPILPAGTTRKGGRPDSSRLLRRFSILKVLTIIGLIILGIIITAGGVPGAEPIGFR